MIHNLAIFLESVAFIYLAYLLGILYFRLSGSKLESALKDATYSVILGYGLWGILGFALALAGLFEKTYLYALALLILFLQRKIIASQFGLLLEWKSFLSRIKLYTREIFSENRYLKLLIVVWIFINFFIVFVPVTGYDTKAYHLPIISEMVAQGRVAFDPASPFFNWRAILVETIYAIPIVLFGDSLDPYVFQILQYSALILFLVLLYEFTKPFLKNRFFGIVPILFLLSTMDFQREIMHGGYIDVFVYLFGITSVLLVIESCLSAEIQNKKLSLSAVLLGVALSSKSIALFFALINGLFLTFLFVKNKLSFPRIAGYFMKYSAVALAISGFWYVKNFFLYGNPVYPIFSMPEMQADIARFIMERDFVNFLFFPFYRFGQWFISDIESSSRLVVLAYFALLYVLILFFIARKRIVTVAEVLIFVFIEIYLLLSFYFSHEIRFMLPVLIMIPPLLAVLLDKLFIEIEIMFGQEFKNKAFRIFQGACVFAFTVLFLGNIHYFKVRFLYITSYYSKAEYVLNIGFQ